MKKKYRNVYRSSY